VEQIGWSGARLGIGGNSGTVARDGENRTAEAGIERFRESSGAAIERAHAYAEAGANGIFAPGLADIALIARLAEASPLPLNIMVGDTTPPLGTLADHGVARVSHGPRFLPPGNEGAGRSSACGEVTPICAMNISVDELVIEEGAAPSSELCHVEASARNSHRNKNRPFNVLDHPIGC
jgi:hypothetical protein